MYYLRSRKSKVDVARRHSAASTRFRVVLKKKGAYAAQGSR